MSQTIADANAAQITICSQPTVSVATLDGIYALVQKMSQRLRGVEEKVDKLSTTLDTTVRDREYVSRSIMLSSTRGSQAVPTSSNSGGNNNNVVENVPATGKKALPPRKKQGAFRDHKPGTIIPAIRIRLHEEDKEIAKAMNGVAFAAKRATLGFQDPYHHIRSSILLEGANAETWELLLQVDCWQGYTTLCKPKYETELPKVLGLDQSYTVRNQYWVEVLHFCLDPNKNSEVRQNVNSQVELWNKETGLNIAQAQLRNNRLFWRFNTVAQAEKACMHVFVFSENISYAM
jgi:hypothetical protein